MSGSHDGQPAREIDPALRTKALEALLVEKGLVSTDAIDAFVHKYEEELGPLAGARVVARAWVDPEFKRRLLEHGSAAIEELGITALQSGQSDIVVVENTPQEHNLVVCTLCSCYPWMLLGLPPTWYKSHAYRSRVVIEPRTVLQEFGVELDESVDVRVWDSTSDIRYLVLPERPAGTEGMSEDELVQLVTRDSMVGVGLPKSPVAAS